MIRSLFRCSLLSLLILTVASCGSSRKGAITGGGTYTPGTAEGEGGIEWSDLKLPVSVNVSKPKSIRISGSMSMVKNQSIYISLRFFGMEVAAAYVTGDSVYAYAKMQRVYVAESIGDALGGLNITVGDLQNILLGAPLTTLPPSTGNTSVDLRTLESTSQPLSITVSHRSGRTATVNYSPLENLPLASEVSIEATSGKTGIAATLYYNWQRAEVDAGNPGHFSLPSGYRRIKGSELLRALSKI